MGLERPPCEIRLLEIAKFIYKKLLGYAKLVFVLTKFDQKIDSFGEVGSRVLIIFRIKKTPEKNS